MPYKDKTVQKQARDRHYQENKDSFRRRQRAARERNRQFIDKVKADSEGCLRCGEKDICCLDFHHRGDKLETVSRLARKSSLENLLKEINKCDILCANCHRMEHYEERNNKAANNKVKNWMRQYKLHLKCSLCQMGKYPCLSFHHLDSSTKVDSISNMIRDNCSMDELLSEIDKCIVLCENCHRKSHNKAET